MGERARLLEGHLPAVQSPPCRPPLTLTTSSQALPPHTVMLEVRASTCDYGGGGHNSVHSSSILFLPKIKSYIDSHNFIFIVASLGVFITLGRWEKKKSGSLGGCLYFSPPPL